MAIRIVFKCGNPKCHAKVDADLLNSVRLKIIRRVAVLCKICKHRTMWIETSFMLDDAEIKNNKSTTEMEGRNARNIGYSH